MNSQIDIPVEEIDRVVQEATAAACVDSFVRHLARVAHAVGWQAGVGASETAGMIVSCLAERPALIERFLKDGAGLIIDGEIAAEKGCLTFHRQDGTVTTPQELRMSIDVMKMKRAASPQISEEGN